MQAHAREISNLFEMLAPSTLAGDLSPLLWGHSGETSPATSSASCHFSSPVHSLSQSYLTFFHTVDRFLKIIPKFFERILPRRYFFGEHYLQNF
jgi:hypothetical protein